MFENSMLDDEQLASHLWNILLPGARAQWMGANHVDHRWLQIEVAGTLVGKIFLPPKLSKCPPTGKRMQKTMTIMPNSGEQLTESNLLHESELKETIVKLPEEKKCKIGKVVCASVVPTKEDLTCEVLKAEKDKLLSETEYYIQKTKESTAVERLQKRFTMKTWIKINAKRMII
uniref:Uncharacterized protein n=1 Tax=Romanomermis culicivorax TaxID=13658 RepID=A0A915K2I5_ROMCU